LIAADAAPALDREYFGFTGWRGHDAGLWEQLRTEARERRSTRAARQTRCILGSDVTRTAVRMAIANGEHAGVAGWLHVEKRSLAEIVRPKGDAGFDRRESAVRRTHRRGVGPARPVLGARRRTARPIRRMGRPRFSPAIRRSPETWGSMPSAPIDFTTAPSSAGCCASI